MANYYRYQIFGLILASQLQFDWPLEKVANSYDVACKIIKVITPFIKNEPQGLFYPNTTYALGANPSKIRIFAEEDGILLSYQGLFEFKIQEKQVAYYEKTKHTQYELEVFLFRTVLILWLESIGVPVMHASGISMQNHAIGFLASSTTGKSTLAAACIRAGAQLMTDDIFPINLRPSGYEAHPSYAWLRLSPEAADALEYKSGQKKNSTHKIPVRLDESYGCFCAHPVPLAALYLPERRSDDTPVLIESLPPKDAYLGLLQHSFLGKWLVNSPLNARRMAFLAQLVRDVPIKRLIYPSGYEHLPAVVAAVRQDLGL